MKKNKQTALPEQIEDDKILIINDIKSIMRSKKKKQNFVADNTPISRTFLSEILTLKKNPSYDTLILIAKCIGAKVRLVIEH